MATRIWFGILLLTLALFITISTAQDRCVFTTHCEQNCNWNGVCTSDLSCICNVGWEGSYCQLQSCSHCSRQSSCRPDGTCLCNPGYSGANCTTLTCLPHTDSCCDKRGNCVCNGRSCPSGAGVDLTVVASAVEPSIVSRTFPRCHCAVDEGCVKAGHRRLLRFNTYILNHSDLDLFIGPPGSADPDDFEFHECHNHAHFLNFASFSLWNSDRSREIVKGMKNGFCLEDTLNSDSSSSAGPVYNCVQQGLQAGWIDIYGSGLDCQWLDISEVPAGEYILSIEVNPTRTIVESNYANNVIDVDIVIPSSDEIFTELA